ncbi:GNAT family N-acetyltransferase [Paenibacillus silagei]|uniref:Ribosomal protein S18 acetylase RimI-like enzyme n=1 Tax=Paenibacillus silagei TaxID=1670801 RepID=A0ABS4NQN4_9BACL|nr:GNAT family N-acetyltransferase [Paenibacillus silagei]MBP2112373.1 ribosomal protein S18 acetylase RimI-like enzyme [Paenibacillus silagei]
MLIDLKPLVGTPQVNELLAYAVIDDPDALIRTSEEYSKLAAMQLCGWEEDGLLVGLTGYEETEDGSLDIRHISVLPENRGKGYARGMILELVTSRQPRYLIAETEDEIAADFYRSLGFMVYSLGENAAGIEMFRCVYEVEETEDEE